MSPLRVVFFGSPRFALPSLSALLDAGHEIALVVTQPDRPAGRGQRVASPPVAEFARAHDLSIWQTPNLKGPEAVERLRSVGADAMALAAFAALVPRAILDLAPTGILNVHPSLLPRWRGAAPIQSALLAGDEQTGVSIIRLVAAMDAGPILAQESVPITPADDYLSLEETLSRLGARMLVESLDRVVAGEAESRPQHEAEATYCAKIQREDGRVDWEQGALTIWRQVRALRGWPQAFTTWDGRLLKIQRATPLDGDGSQPGTVSAVNGTPAVATGNGLLRLDVVTLEGKRPASGADFLRGHPDLAGARLGP